MAYIGASTAFSASSRRDRPSVFAKGGYTYTRASTPAEMAKYWEQKKTSEDIRKQVYGETGRVSAFQGLLAKMEAQSEGARAANIARREQIGSIYEDIIGGLQAPDSPFRKATEMQLETTKRGDVGAGAQRLISSGLYGTEQAGGLETAWEAQVGAPARLKMEDIIAERTREAKLGKAGFLERIEEPYPSYGLLAQLAAQIGNV